MFATGASDLISRGDGTYTLKPGPPVPNAGAWLTVREAAQLLNLKPARIYPLLGDLLVYHRPLSNVRHVSRPSALALQAAIHSNPRFWTDQAAKAELRAAVEKEMRKAIESSLQSPC